MVFGILKDIKEGEYRVICTPMEVKSIVAAGHEVWAQHDCGKAAGFPDEKYAEAGAKIVDTMEEMFYCGLEVCGDRTYHLVKRRGRGQRPISILVGSRTTSVYVK